MFRSSLDILEPLHCSVHRVTDIPELLQEVFLFCLPEAFHVHNAMEAPILLCKVSRYWRALAISTPQLWSRLHVVVRTKGPSPPSQTIARWLELSGHVPLTISFQDQSSGVCQEVPHLLSLLFAEMWRWRDIRILAMPTNFGAISTLHHPVVLESLDLIACSGKELQELLMIVNTSPALTGLKLSNGITIEPDVIASTLTTIFLSHITSVQGCLDMLARCPHLRNCTLRFDSQNATSTEVTGDLAHSNLETLDISACSEPIAALLSAVSFPRLASLQIYIHTITFPIVHFTSFLTRSRCRLMHLDLTNAGFTPESFTEAMSHPSLIGLTSLRVAEVWIEMIPTSFISDEVLQRLTKNRLGYLLPSLQDLSIQSQALECSPGMLAGMVESRCESQESALDRLLVSFRQSDVGCFEEDIAKLELLEKKQKIEFHQDIRKHAW